MKQWHEVLQQVLDNGERRDDRTGVGTLSVFGATSRFDLRDGFPAVTTKKLFFNQVAAELAAFLAGAETLDEFHKFDCNIWDANGMSSYWLPRARFEGDLGRIYGVQWRRFRSWHEVSYARSTSGKETSILPHSDNVVLRQTDQLRDLVEHLRGDPFSRRHVVTAWNPGELEHICLPPCHVMFQCYVSANRQFLDLRFDLRSVDLFIGWPFDVASYALLAHLLAQSTGLTPRWLWVAMGDAHIYLNHLDQVGEVLSRAPLRSPMLCLSGAVNVLEFHRHQASLADYASHPPVRAKMNV